jgi:hypothetical protein
MPARYESWRFLLLSGFLLSILLMVPVILRYRLLHVLLSLLFLNGLFVSLSAAGLAARWRWVFGAIWLLNASAWFAAEAVGDPRTELVLFSVSRSAAFLLLGGCVAATLRYVLTSTRVTADRIFAAIVAYQLAALGFAVLFHLIVGLDPRSFAFPQATPSVESDGLLVQLIYFSFVTIATLGYGDIVPRSPLAQMISTVEATLGQFYIAVVIAWLVGVYASRHPRAAAE